MSQAEGTAQALVVGISSYRHVGKLRPTRDVAGVREVLESPNYCGYPAERVKVLEEDDATRDHILDALAATCANARSPDSRTFLYFSGHGGQGSDGVSYILPVDARKGAYPGTAISARELAAFFDRCHGDLTVVLDCCRAAGVASPDAQDEVGLGALTDAFRHHIQPRRSDLQSIRRVVFAASRASGKAFTSPEVPYGIFTGHMLDGLRGAASTDGRDVTVHQLFDYVSQRVVLSSNGTQRPSFIAATESFYPLTRYPRPVAPSVVFEKDVYISYDNEDPALRAWVARVFRPELEKPGVRLSIWDHDDLGYSKFAVEEALVKSRYVVVLLTPSFLTNRMDELTTTMAVLQAVDTRTPRFLSILRERCRPPLYIQAFVGLDMSPQREMDFRRNMDRLISRLKRQPHEK
jgi:hypothetical protein